MRAVIGRAAVSVIAFVAALEIGLRLYNPFPFRVRGDRIVLPVYQRYTITHAGATKLDPVNRVTKNSLGFRGPEPPRDWSRWFTILTIGGSTTECFFLSDGKTWTDQLGRRISTIRSDVWINNAGIEGHSTFGHLALLDQFVGALRPTMAIFLFGVNDMKLAKASRMDEATTPQSLSRTHRVLTFAADHSEVAALGENLMRMARTYRADLGDGELRADQIVAQPLAESITSAVLAEHRSKYLAGFAQRVAGLVAASRRYGIEPVFMTQPALWGDGIDPSTGISLGDAKTSQGNGHLEWQVLELYNDVTRKVSADAGVPLIDLAREMPKDSRYFSDWFHYTNEGAVLIGDVIFRHLEPRLRGLSTGTAGR